MKLLANGCSMTHGQELVTDGYDPANTHKSYARKIFDEDDINQEILKKMHNFYEQHCSRWGVWGLSLIHI